MKTNPGRRGVRPRVVSTACSPSTFPVVQLQLASCCPHGHAQRVRSVAAGLLMAFQPKLKPNEIANLGVAWYVPPQRPGSAVSTAVDLGVFVEPDGFDPRGASIEPPHLCVSGLCFWTITLCWSGEPFPLACFQWSHTPHQRNRKRAIAPTLPAERAQPLLPAAAAAHEGRHVRAVQDGDGQGHGLHGGKHQVRSITKSPTASLTPSSPNSVSPPHHGSNHVKNGLVGPNQW